MDICYLQFVQISLLYVCAFAQTLGSEQYYSTAAALQLHCGSKSALAESKLGPIWHQLDPELLKLQVTAVPWTSQLPLPPTPPPSGLFPFLSRAQKNL